MKSISKLKIIAFKNNLYHPRRVVNLLKSLAWPKIKKSQYFPIMADIEPTIACNLDCVMCHRKGLLKNRKKITMSFDEFKIILDRLPTIIKLNLQGMGEPLLAKDFFRMVEYAKKKKIIVTTVTNGLLMNNDLSQKIIAAHLDRIYISIDSTDPQKYATYRKNGELSLLLKNARNLIELRNETKNSNLQIGIWMLLFNDNLDDIIPMAKLAEEIGADELVYQLNINDRSYDKLEEKIDLMRVSEKSQVFQEIEKAEKMIRRQSFKISVHKEIGFLKPNREALCLWPWKSAYINSEGDISSCCIIADSKISNLGNLLNQDLKDIWNNEAYQSLRQQLLAGDIPKYCRQCYGKK